MTFRGRLRLFFTIIVIVPMVAVALVLFTLTAESETGKADAAIAAGMQTAFALYSDASDRAEASLRRMARDEELRTALASRRTRSAAARMRTLVGRAPSVVSIVFYDPSGRAVARAGARTGVGSATAPVGLGDGARIGTLSLSVTSAERFVREVARISGLQVSVFRSGRRLASTLPRLEGAPELGEPDRSLEFESGDAEYRGRVDRISRPAGPPLEVAVFQESGELSRSIAENRELIAVILGAFLLLALASSVFVVRALQGQIGEFLTAARRLARGDFGRPVPTQGRDEFARLGEEFNSMSGQLEEKLLEIERKRRELEETIRRVGAGLASGLDRQGIVRLAVETAVDACQADVGRALPVDRETFEESTVGSRDGSLATALEQAERQAFEVRPTAAGEQDGTRPVGGNWDGAHALAVPMIARLGERSAPQYVGVVSIARRERPFTAQEQELLAYLAGQAVISIENADLHRTVQRQAVTDELTGLANMRELHGTLDREVERSRRFNSSLGLVMLDIDDFKHVNDTYGHQQGDLVLVEVARVLREHSRDIDEPARYGGEELCMVLPETDAEGAVLLAERMRVAIEGIEVTRLDGGAPLRVTASFGVASLPDTATDKYSLIAAADAALYSAKRAGKNRVERADPVSAPR